jgi:hypothetical protein
VSYLGSYIAMVTVRGRTLAAGPFRTLEDAINWASLSGLKPGEWYPKSLRSPEQAISEIDKSREIWYNCLSRLMEPNK